MKFIKDERRELFVITTGLISICLIMNLLFNISIKRLNVKTVEISSNEVTTTVSKQIAEVFKDANKVTDYIGKNKTVRSYLENVDNYFDIRGEGYDEVLEELINIRDINDYFYLTWIGDDSTDYFIDSSGYVSDSEFKSSKRPWYKNYIEEEGVSFTDPYLELGGKEVVVSSIKPIELKNRMAFVAVDFSFKGIENIFNQLKTKDVSKMYLLNDEGKYLYCEDKKKILSGSFFVDYMIPEKTLIDIRIHDTYFDEVKIDKKSYYINTKKLENSNWILVSLIDKKNLFNEIDNVFIVDFFVSIIILVVIVLLVNSYVLNNLDNINDIKNILKTISLKNNPNIASEKTYLNGSMGDIYRYLSEINFVVINNIDKEKEEKCIEVESKIEEIKNCVEKVYGDIQQPISVMTTTESFLKKLVEISRKKSDNGLMTSEDLDKLLHDLEEVNLIIKNNINKIIKHTEKLNYSKYNS